MSIDTPWAPAASTTVNVAAAPKKPGIRLGLWLIANLYVLMFVGLKLAGVIAWSWWAVFSPLLILVGVLLVMFALVGLVAVIESIAEKRRARA